ncbi:polyprenyl diphosphate synthase [Rickettsiales bacterium LUAb2]
MNSNQNNAPNHIAVVMDGNRRWARYNSFSYEEAYSEATKSIESAISVCNANNIQYLTLFAFSHDNAKRDIKEIILLKKLISNYLKQEAENLIRNNIKLKVIGDYYGFSKDIAKQFDDLILKTANNNKLTLTIALNYSGKMDIVQGVNKFLINNPNNKNLTIEELSSNLYSNYMPDPDILIRTGGEKRISNFLLWQLSYTELFFLNIMWPEFREIHFNEVLTEFNNRERRYGK